jgi:O-glycosyl hydrolase
MTTTSASSFPRLLLKCKVRMPLLALSVALSGSPLAAQNIITLQPGTHYQTISGWECVAWAAQESATFPNYREELLRRVVNEAGITRVRLEVRSGSENPTDYWTLFQQGQVEYSVWRANRYATINDNNDPNTFNPAGFHFSELDNTIERIVLPLRELVQANGETLYVNLNYVAFTAQIPQGGGYHHNDPAEYAEFILAVFQHMDARHGFTPDALEILLEPDNVSQWNGNLIGRAIVAVKKRLNEAGYDCEFIAPCCTSMANAITYFDAMAQVNGAIQALTELCYHRYSGVSDSNLAALANRAAQHNLRTSMLEWWSNNNSHHILHQDLKAGNNSAWQHGALGGTGAGLDDSMTLYRVDTTNPASPVVSLNRKGRLARQYYRFVRPGAVRIGAQTTNATFDPLAFVNPAGEWVVVVKAAAGGSFTVRGLPAGAYAVTYSTPTAFDAALPARNIAEGGEITVTMPRDGVCTIYSKNVRLLDPTLREERFAASIATLVPHATATLQRSSDPADSSSWSDVNTITMKGMREEWSVPLEPADEAVFYRVVLPSP